MLPISNCPFVDIAAVADIASSALAYNKAPLAILDKPVPPLVTATVPVTAPVKSIEVKKPAALLSQRLKSIPASNTVNSIFPELVPTVNKPVSPDLIPLNTI